MKKLTIEEAKSIVLAEKAHWEKFNSDMSIGAIGACANIYATLCGIRAPWHPAPKPLCLTPKQTAVNSKEKTK